MARALVPVVIVGIIAISAVLIVIISKVKRRDPQIKNAEANTRLVHDANRIFSRLIEQSDDYKAMSVLTEEHKLLVKNWKNNYRKANGFE